ncbi:MAG: peroxidase-related enzyme [Gammaproteobacteria bacterium]|nr:peroxidase-related enzyme [Gammaproteobacteria bacterium]MDH3373424.1 peroxidase-related enzyme [Gammaproteobacteria bacterium]MDH3409193.1 peroxidase-related enzyme [Gammaproteobacteria bacterium]MDH3551091.1 peroxidase-related enzyme [Gammaproteobacteria bacterium]
MSWIDEIEAGDADGKLSEMYAELVKKRGKISNILKVHSLNPEAMGNHLDLYMTIMFGRSGLSRAEREAIAVVVSATNECAYCVNHHAEALKRYIKDGDTLEMLTSADGLETLEPRLSNIVRHAEKLTSAPSAMTESDLGELRAVGLSDRDILDLTLIVAYFNFVNRIAMGLGVAYSAEELSGYRDE